MGFIPGVEQMVLERSKRFLTMIFLSWFFFIFVILLNLLPSYESFYFPGFDWSRSIEVDSTIVFKQQWALDYEYDLTKLDNDKYLLSLTNNQISCTSWGETCQLSTYRAGSIQLLDSDFQTIWQTGDANSAHPGIEIDNIEFTPFGADQLTDGSIVSIGESIDTITANFNVTLFFFDESGNPTSYQHINLKGKGIINKGHAQLEVLHTENGGFTVQISGTRSGSVIIHYNASGVEEWQTIVGESNFVNTNDPLVNIYYVDFTYYSLYGNSITAIHNDGSFKWSKNYEFDITGFDLTDDGEIVLSGSSKKSFIIMVYYLGTNYHELNALIYHVGILNKEDGTFNWKNEFQTIYYTSENAYARHTVTDIEGNYYMLVQSTRDIETHYAILKYNSIGEYIGQTTFVAYFPYNMTSDWFQSYNNKIDVVFNQDTLNILMPDRKMMTSLDLAEVEWNPTLPISLDLNLINQITYVRVWTNRVLLIILISGISYFFIHALVKKEKPVDYCEHPVNEHE